MSGIMYKRLEECVYQYLIDYEVANQEPLFATKEMIADFKKNGYIVIRNNMDASEVGKILASQEAAFERHQMTENKYNVGMHFWNNPGNDVVGKAIGCDKLCLIAEQLLGEGELYLYHGKTLVKKPHTEGVFCWHQDYGYWYYNECLYPNMITVLTALTPSNPGTGGMELIAGSNRAGRIDHKHEGPGAKEGTTSQMVADSKWVEELKSRGRGVIKVSLNPGDALFMHSLTLHASGPNTGNVPRWHFLLCYNTKENNPLKEHFHARYGDYKLSRYPSTAVRDCDVETMPDEYEKYLTADKNPYVHK